MSCPQAKEYLLQKINDFIQERIEFADEVISSHGAAKIVDGDCIMVYAWFARLAASRSRCC